MGLARIASLLAALGNPETALPPVIHIAGTNGKGSTAAYIAAASRAAGRRVHVYGSPHLIRLEECLTLAGRPIEDAALAAHLERCAATGATATAFEALTAAAFLAMAETPADLAVIEAGLGGGADATNALPAPRVAVLTPVARDHAEFLGDTIAAIAADEAGIIKPGAVAVAGPQPAEAMAAIEARAQAVNAPVWAHGEAWTVGQDDRGLRYAGRRWRFAGLPAPAMAGRHQTINAGLALAALEALGGFELDAAAAAAAMAVRLPGRLQRLDPSCFGLPPGTQLWLDGGHNPGAGQALADWAAEGERLVLVVGMLASKDAAGFLAPLAPHAARVYAVPVVAERPGMDPDVLAATARGLGLSAEPCSDVPDALARAGAAPRILICGSLYLAGAVLRMSEFRRRSGADGL